MNVPHFDFLLRATETQVSHWTLNACESIQELRRRGLSTREQRDTVKLPLPSQTREAHRAKLPTTHGHIILTPILPLNSLRRFNVFRCSGCESFFSFACSSSSGSAIAFNLSDGAYICVNTNSHPIGMIPAAVAQSFHGRPALFSLCSI